MLPADKMQRPQAVARFEREMKAVGKLDHPNIVRAHDAGEVDGVHFLVMELVEGIDLAKADIYSLGGTLYKLLVGDPPFSGERHSTLTQKLIATATEEPPPIQEQRPDLPDDVAAIVHRCLAKTPGERYATPEELAQALAPFASSADMPKLLTAVGMTPTSPAKMESHGSDTSNTSNGSRSPAPRYPMPGWPASRSSPSWIR